MTMQNEKKEKEEKDGQDGTAGQGGASGKINFRYKDSFSIGPNDDAVIPAQQAHLLAQHKEIHKARVDKQKQLRKDRILLKQQQDQKIRQGQGIRGGYASSHSSRYNKHPKLLKMRGIDPQVISVPSENMANTNEDKRNENKNELRYQPAPRFSPKLRPF